MYLDRSTQHGLVERDGHLHADIITVAFKDWVTSDGDLHFQVPAATRALLALTFDAHSLTVFDTGWDAYLLACTVTGRDVLGDAADGFGKTDGDAGFDVRAFGGLLLLETTATKPSTRAAKAPEDITETTLAPAAGLAEQPGKDVFESGLSAAGTAGESCTGAHASQLVIFLALLRIRQDCVGFGNFFEALFGGCVVGVSVGVIFSGELTVGLLDFSIAGVLIDA